MAKKENTEKEKVEKKTTKKSTASKKAEPKKTSTAKKPSTKATTKKTTTRRKKVVKEEVPVVEKQLVQEEVVAPIEEEKTEVVEEVVEEKTEVVTPAYEAPQTPPAPKKKKKHPILIALGIILVLVLVFGAFILIEANNVSSMEDKFDDINVLKAACVDPASVKDHDEAVEKAIASAISACDIDLSAGKLTVNVSKGVVYNIVDLDIINEAVKEYGITVNRFGYSFDTENQLVDAYLSAKKSFISCGIHAQLAYELTDNEIILNIKDVEIGKLPRFLYEKYVPKDVEIGRFDVSKVKVFDDVEIKVFSPNKIQDIKYENNILSLSYSASDLLNDVINDLFVEDNNGNKKIETVANDILESIGLEDVKINDVVDIFTDIASLFKEFVPDLNNLLPMFK